MLAFHDSILIDFKFIGLPVRRHIHDQNLLVSLLTVLASAHG